MLNEAKEQDGKFVIKYDKKFTRHTPKFKLAFDYLQREGKNDCIVINKEGAFTSDSFYWNDFELGLLPETEARLGVFYSDIEYDTVTNEMTATKKTPIVNVAKLRSAIDCLKRVVSQWKV